MSATDATSLIYDNDEGRGEIFRGDPGVHGAWPDISIKVQAFNRGRYFTRSQSKATLGTSQHWKQIQGRQSMPQLLSHLFLRRQDQIILFK